MNPSSEVVALEPGWSEIDHAQGRVEQARCAVHACKSSFFSAFLNRIDHQLQAGTEVATLYRAATVVAIGCGPGAEQEDHERSKHPSCR
jgi:hypothetical protein